MSIQCLEYDDTISDAVPVYLPTTECTEITSDNGMVA